MNAGWAGVMFGCGVGDRGGWPCGVCGELAVVRFCATAVVCGSMGDVVGWGGSAWGQTSRLSAGAVGWLSRSLVDLMLVCVWMLVTGCRCGR